MSSSLPDRDKQRRQYPAVRKGQRRAFLEALATGYSVAHAAEHAGVLRRRFYELRDADETFRSEWAEALAAGTEVLTDEVRRRGVEGVEEPVYQGGQLVGHIRRYSDNLLMFLLKRRDPAFRDSSRVELTGRDGGAVQIENPDVADAIGRFTAAVQLAAQRRAELEPVELAPVEPVDGELVEGEPTE